MTVRRLIAVLCSLIALADGPLGAAEVRIEVSSRDAFVDEVMKVSITVTTSDSHEQPAFPSLDWAEVSGPEVKRGTQTFSINFQSATYTTTTYTYSVVPDRPGVFAIPAISVEAEGKHYSTTAQRIRVRPSNANELLFLRLSAEREKLYVGEVAEVKLEIWMQVYKDRNLPEGMTPQNMLSLIDRSSSEWGRFKICLTKIDQGDLKWQYRRETRRTESGQEAEYYVFVLPLRLTPVQTGPLDAGSVTVVSNYPAGTRRVREFLMSDLRVTGYRVLQARLGVPDVVVKSPPQEGRPALFSGAVGRFGFKAEAHTTDARVREPIELTMTITGEGDLEQVPPPPLTAIQPLTRDFKVPAEKLTGTVGADGKRFVTTIRATNADVEQIPPIPFVYFDPLAERYVTLSSDPIPVTIRPTETVSVGAFDDSSETTETGAARLTETAAGIRANYADLDEVLAQQGFEPGWGTAGVVGAMPVLYALALVVTRQRTRVRTDQAYARRRGAMRRASNVLDEAGRTSSPSERASAVAAAVVGYVADRLNLPTGLTAAETIQRLESAGVNPKLIERTDGLLRRCEDLQYAGAAEAGDDLPAMAEQCLRDLEREGL